MEELTMNVNWLAVIVGAVLAYLLGWAWYSRSVFGEKWAEGSRIDRTATSGSMAKPMLAQAVGTFLLAWVIGITATTDSLSFAILIGLTIAALVKAGGLFAQKNNYAVMVDGGFIIAMVVVMVLVHGVL